MQTDPTTIKLILALSDLGWSSRKIAHVADVSKSTVNNYMAAAALREQFAAYVEYQAAVPERQVKNISLQDRLSRSFENLKADCIENALPHVPSVYLAPDASAEMKEIYEQFKEIAGNVQVSATPPRILYHPELQYDPKDVAFNQPKKQGPRILFYDLEVAGDIGLFFGRHKINISQEAIVKKGGFILCASWKILGEESVESIHLTKDEVEAGDDSRIVEKLRKLYEESDAVICHNSKGYDHKVLQARSAYWDYPALPLVKVLDTLELAKRNLRLPSNKLGSIAAYFNLPLKLDHSGVSLWVGVQSGDVAAMATMVEYCKQDVVVLEEVYNKLKQTGKAGSDFNAAMYFEDNAIRCRTCGSDDLEATGRTVVTSSSTYDEYVCLGCGSVHRSKVNKTNKEKRKSLLAAAKI